MPGDTPSVPSDLREALDRCLDGLVPPRDNATARSLATAGEPVLARLPDSLNGLTDTAATATIQTAWLVNGPDALNVLSRYATDQRLDVQRELSKAWQYFDPSEYAERVLVAMPPGGHVSVLSSAQFVTLDKISPLARLEVHQADPVDLGFLEAHAASLRDLSLYYDQPGADLTTLPELPNLRGLSVGLPGLADLGFLDALPPLDVIWFIRCRDIEDYTPLLRFTALRALYLSGSRWLRSLRQLPPLGS